MISTVFPNVGHGDPVTHTVIPLPIDEIIDCGEEGVAMTSNFLYGEVTEEAKFDVQTSLSKAVHDAIRGTGTRISIEEVRDFKISLPQEIDGLSDGASVSEAPMPDRVNEQVLYLDSPQGRIAAVVSASEAGWRVDWFGACARTLLPTEAVEAIRSSASTSE